MKIIHLINTIFDIIGKSPQTKQTKQIPYTQGTGSLSTSKTSHLSQYLCTLPGQDQATAKEALISTLE